MVWRNATVRWDGASDRPRQKRGRTRQTGCGGRECWLGWRCVSTCDRLGFLGGGANGTKDLAPFERRPPGARRPPSVETFVRVTSDRHKHNKHAPCGDTMLQRGFRKGCVLWQAAPAAPSSTTLGLRRDLTSPWAVYHWRASLTQGARGVEQNTQTAPGGPYRARPPVECPRITLFIVV